MIEKINYVVMCLFFICYSYQFFYILVSWLRKPKPHKPEAYHRIAVLIAARNEQTVIGNLIDSIKAQDYPAELLDIYLVADNCTDGTAEEARRHGATVFERHDISHVGKGYALKFLLEQVDKTAMKAHDAYLVLDADNVISSDFVTEINRTYTDGYEIVTCYRNSKNYGDNWISAGYALWFLRESRYLNGARTLLGNSCAVSGTGFLFSRRILEKCGGWHYFLLTEDIEFSVDNIVRGEKIGYASGAVLYDEQPVSFAQSWRQRMRWSRGYLQVIVRYGRELIKGIFRGDFSCFDMTMNICPAAVLTCFSVIINGCAAISNLIGGGSLQSLGISVLTTLTNLYLTMFLVGGITTVTEWRSIHCPAYKKLLYVFTFPVFMFTYLPICVASFFKNPQWKPISHSRNLNLHQIRQNNK